VTTAPESREATPNRALVAVLMLMIATVIGMASYDIWTVFADPARALPADLGRDLAFAMACALMFGGVIAQQFQRHGLYKVGLTLSLPFLVLSLFL